MKKWKYQRCCQNQNQQFFLNYCYFNFFSQDFKVYTQAMYTAAKHNVKGKNSKNANNNRW